MTPTPAEIEAQNAARLARTAKATNDARENNARDARAANLRGAGVTDANRNSVRDAARDASPRFGRFRGQGATGRVRELLDSAKASTRDDVNDPIVRSDLLDQLEALRYELDAPGRRVQETIDRVKAGGSVDGVDVAASLRDDLQGLEQELEAKVGRFGGKNLYPRVELPVDANGFSARNPHAAVVSDVDGSVTVSEPAGEPVFDARGQSLVGPGGKPKRNFNPAGEPAFDGEGNRVVRNPDEPVDADGLTERQRALRVAPAGTPPSGELVRESDSLDRAEFGIPGEPGKPATKVDVRDETIHDAAGKRLVDAKGRFVDVRGRLVDAQGTLVPVDAQGNPTPKPAG